MDKMLDTGELGTIETLILNMQGLNIVSRQKLYGAIDVLLVRLISHIENSRCDNEEVYLQLGEVLDDCRLLADSVSIREAEQHIITRISNRIATLRADLRMLPLCC